LLPVENEVQAESANQSYQIGKPSESHTIGAYLIKLAIVNTVSTVLNQETAQKFEALPLSATTVKRNIIKISKNVLGK
jgi:hypothetical protein